MTASVERTERLHILLSKEESEMLKALANHKGLSASDYLRLHIRESWLRCAWCGAEAKMRQWKGARKAWALHGGVRVCPDCAPSVVGNTDTPKKGGR